MIGMDIRLGNDPSGRRMFLPWALIGGALATFLMCLCTFLLHPDMHTSFASLLGASWFAIFDQFMAEVSKNAFQRAFLVPVIWTS